MRKITLTCDRCKKEVSDLIEVGAGKADYNYSARGYTFCQLRAEWCDNCCIEMRVAKPNPTSDAKPVDSPPTIEDFIREIIREEIDNSK